MQIDPVVWLLGALASLAGFTAWLVKWVLAHMQKDIDALTRVAERGATTAERATTVAEAKAD